MTKDNNGKRNNLVFGIIVAAILGVCSWALLGMISVDKEVSTMKRANEIEHEGFEKADETILREQRSMSRKIDRVDRTMTKIATKLDVDSP